MRARRGIGLFPVWVSTPWVGLFPSVADSVSSPSPRWMLRFPYIPYVRSVSTLRCPHAPGRHELSRRALRLSPVNLGYRVRASISTRTGSRTRSGEPRRPHARGFGDWLQWSSTRCGHGHGGPASRGCQGRRCNLASTRHNLLETPAATSSTRAASGPLPCAAHLPHPVAPHSVGERCATGGAPPRKVRTARGDAARAEHGSRDLIL
jgi:hypothetical protein